MNPIMERASRWNSNKDSLNESHHGGVRIDQLFCPSLLCVDAKKQTQTSQSLGKFLLNDCQLLRFELMNVSMTVEINKVTWKHEEIFSLLYLIK